jgi:hypothetical protein
MGVLTFSTILSNTFHILRTILRDIFIHVYMYSCKVPVILDETGTLFLKFCERA